MSAQPPAKSATFRDVFAVGEFRALWLAYLASVAGDQLALVAVTVLVYDRTRSPLLTALAYSAGFLPWAIGGITLSRLADRYPRRTVMVACDTARVGIVAVMAIPAVPIYLVVLLLAVVTLLDSPFRSARSAMLPDILSGDRYVVGQAAMTITNRTGRTLGLAGGGIAVAVIGAHAALAADAATFAFSAVVVRTGVRPRAVHLAEHGQHERQSVITRVFRDPRLRTLMLFGWLVPFYAVPEGVAAPYAHMLHGGSVATGLILAAGPAGGIVGSVVFPRLVRPDKRQRYMGPLAIAACAILALCFTRLPLIASLVVFAASTVCSCYQFAANAAFVKAVQPSWRGQAFGLANGGINVGQSLWFAAAGAAADALSPAVVVGLSGLIGTAIAVSLAVSWRRLPAIEPVPATSLVPVVPHDTPKRQLINIYISAGRRNSCQARMTGCRAALDELPLRCDDELSARFVMLSMFLPGVAGFYMMITNLCRQCNPVGWEFWRLPGRVRAYILGLNVAAFTVLGVAAANTRWHARDAAVFAVLACCGAVTIEVTRRVRVVYGTVTRDMQTVWYICAVALCPLFYVMLLPVILAPYRIARMTRVVKYRQIFSGSACALAYGGAAAVFSAMPHSLGSKSGPEIIAWLAVLAACGALGLVVNNALIIAALRLNDPSCSVRKQALDREGAVTDCCQLSLAVLISLPAAFSSYLLVAAIPIVVVMRRFMMHDQLLTAARVDPKTGLLNAATWHREAELEVARAERTRTPLAIAIADIDHFKLVNDEHGHLAGDAALSLISATMSALLRDYDLLGRFGGEEFAICLPHTDPAEAYQVADRLRQKISMISTQAPGAPVVQITISVGVASLESAHRTLDELIAAADAALYRAKASGRNCVVLSQEERLRSTG